MGAFEYTALEPGGRERKGILEGERKLVVKTNDVAAARRSDYESFRNAAHSDEDQLLTCSILTPEGQSADAGSKLEGTAAELQKAGMKSLQSKDYRSAIDLLKRAVDKNKDKDKDKDRDSTIKDGWYDLGLAYAAANNHVEAIAAFRKQLEQDPNHQHANLDLAIELQQTGKTTEAVAAYRKQLEATPYDKSTHKNLGLLLAQLNKDADARTELEAAAALPAPTRCTSHPRSKRCRSLAQSLYSHAENRRAPRKFLRPALLPCRSRLEAETSPLPWRERY